KKFYHLAAKYELDRLRQTIIDFNPTQWSSGKVSLSSLENCYRFAAEEGSPSQLKENVVRLMVENAQSLPLDQMPKHIEFMYKNRIEPLQSSVVSRIEDDQTFWALLKQHATAFRST